MKFAGLGIVPNRLIGDDGARPEVGWVPLAMTNLRPHGSFIRRAVKLSDFRAGLSLDTNGRFVMIAFKMSAPWNIRKFAVWGSQIGIAWAYISIAYEYPNVAAYFFGTLAIMALLCAAVAAGLAAARNAIWRRRDAARAATGDRVEPRLIEPNPPVA
jgi:hypothetical protein